MWCSDNTFCRPEGETGFKGQTKRVNSEEHSGFTLIELMVTMVIMVIVAGAALVIFRSTAQHEVRQQENLEQSQMLRAAFNTVIRDVCMAGNGLAILGTPLIQVYVPAGVFAADGSDTQEDAGWFKYKGVPDYGARAIYGTDSDSAMNEADTLTIFRAEVEAVNPIGRLVNEYTPSVDFSLTLKENLQEGVDITSGDIIALTTGTVAIILQAELSGTTSVLTLGQRFNPEEKMKEPADFTFPVGTVIYNLKDVSFVTYYLDTDNLRLMANYHDQVQTGTSPDTFEPNIAAVASNIEDFQVNYYVAPSVSADPVPVPSLTWDQLAPAGVNWVNAVKIGMVSRSATDRNQGQGSPVELMGHKSSDVSGFARRLLVENVQLRNY